MDGHAIEVASPKWLKSRDTQLDELQAKRDRCDKKSCKVEITDKLGSATGHYYYKPSRRWKSLDRALKKSYRKRREQTKTFMFTITHQLVASYDCIGIGDYAPKNLGYSTKMRRAMNNRSLQGKFKDVLSWVGKKSGKTVIVYDKKGRQKHVMIVTWSYKVALSHVLESGNAPVAEQSIIEMKMQLLMA